MSKKLEFVFNGVLTKYSTDVVKDKYMKRCSIKSTNEEDIIDFIEDIAAWGKSTDPISNLVIQHNTEMNPDTNKTVNLSEYSLYTTVTVGDASVDAKIQSIKMSVKSKKIKGEGVKKRLEAVLNFEFPLGNDEYKLETLLKYKEFDPITGKGSFKNFEFDFVECESYEPEEEMGENDEEL